MIWQSTACLHCFLRELDPKRKRVPRNKRRIYRMERISNAIIKSITEGLFKRDLNDKH